MYEKSNCAPAGDAERLHCRLGIDLAIDEHPLASDVVLAKTIHHHDGLARFAIFEQKSKHSVTQAQAEFHLRM